MSSLVIFLLGLAFMLVLMIKTKFGPFVCMLIASLVIGLCCDLGTTGTINTIVSGFAATCKSLGLLVIFGTILGIYLEKSNACQRIASTMMKFTGKKNATLALCLTGYVVAIPVFCDVALVLLSPIIKNVGKQSGKNACVLGTATACSLLSTNAFVAPTPAPLAIIAILGLGIGTSIAWGLLAAAIVTVAVWLFCDLYLARKPESFFTKLADQSEEIVMVDEDKMPSFTRSMIPILLPIVLIMIASISNQFLPKGSALHTLLTFLGDKNIALALGIAASVICLGKYLPEETRYTPMSDALKTSGTIVFITAAGGALSAIVAATGVGKTIAEILAASPIPVILIPFLITGFSKFAQGSASVTGMLAAGLVLPLCNAGLLTPLDAFLSISAGAALGSHVNNSFTWVFSEFMGYDIKTTMKTLCVAQNIIMALSGLAAAVLIHSIVA